MVYILLENQEPKYGLLGKKSSIPNLSGAGIEYGVLYISDGN
jgi:hypothetical protein